ncbi:unnamed protein product [Rhizophagus irregularis]|nr:unnamed protein product [Rhizophagus irregularis]
MTATEQLVIVEQLENNVHAIYCICGLTADNKQHTVTLVTQEKLEAARKGQDENLSIKVANEPVLNTNKDATTVTSTLVSQSIDVKESPKPEKVDEKKLAKSKSTSSEKSTPITVAIKNMVSQASDKTSDIDSVSNKTAPQDGSEASNKKEKKERALKLKVIIRKSDEAIDFEISEEGKAANKQKNDKESLQSDDNSQIKVTTKDKVVKKRKSYKVADDLNQQEVEASKIVERKMVLPHS